MLEDIVTGSLTSANTRNTITEAKIMPHSYIRLRSEFCGLRQGVDTDPSKRADIKYVSVDDRLSRRVS